MKITIHQINDSRIAEIISDDILIKNTQDALDLLGELYFDNVHKVIIYEKNFIPEFFDLKTKIAGDILQKYTNYNIQLAVVGNYEKYDSKSMKDFIFESNKLKQINFVSSLAEGLEKLAGTGI